MEEAIKAVASVPATSQMFVVAIVCLVGFGWIFVKVLNKQTDILGDVKEVLMRQSLANETRIAQDDKMASVLVEMAKELALHRMATELRFDEMKQNKSVGS